MGRPFLDIKKLDTLGRQDSDITYKTYKAKYEDQESERFFIKKDQNEKTKKAVVTPYKQKDEITFFKDPNGDVLEISRPDHPKVAHFGPGKKGFKEFVAKRIFGLE